MSATCEYDIIDPLTNLVVAWGGADKKLALQLADELSAEMGVELVLLENWRG